VLVVHGTKKFLDRVGRQTAESVDASTTALGTWYATALFWKPRVALFVNESTLLPVLMPLAPAATIVDRFRATRATVLEAHSVDSTFIDHELAEMSEHRLAATKNRSVIGVMNEFVHLCNVYRREQVVCDLVALSLWLAEVPCGPLYARNGSPDRGLAAFVAQYLG